jgi:hypothetical protein
MRPTLPHFWLVCHAALDAASSLPARSPALWDEGRSLFFWIPAGVYPDENRGRNDNYSKRIYDEVIGFYSYWGFEKVVV